MISVIPASSNRASAVGTVYRVTPAAADSPRPRTEAPARQAADRTRSGAHHDARREAATPSAALLAYLIHRMGGANTSLARGAYVNLRV